MSPPSLTYTNLPLTEALLGQDHRPQLEEGCDSRSSQVSTASNEQHLASKIEFNNG